MKSNDPRKGRKMQKDYVLPRKYVTVGNYLAEARDKAGLTQREVSLALGYSSAQFISNFERGIAVPPLKKLKILMKLYDIRVDTVVEMILDAEREIMSSVLEPKVRKRERHQSVNP
jgi:transcriptional regulator with XRE-family HTH domain